MNNLRDGNILLTDVDDDVFKVLIYNILPKGNILHYFDNKVEEIVTVIDRCHSLEGIIYHLPFISNIDNIDPFTLA